MTKQERDASSSRSRRRLEHCYGGTIATQSGNLRGRTRFVIENPNDVVTVVVDATFGHRIATEERERFEQAESGGEIVSPPAGRSAEATPSC